MTTVNQDVCSLCGDESSSIIWKDAKREIARAAFCGLHNERFVKSNRYRRGAMLAKIEKGAGG